MSLIAHYKLDGNANDALGKYNGTASNVTWVDGKLGQAGSFNGSSSSVNGMPIKGLKGDRQHSMSFWLYANSLSDYRQDPISLGNSADNQYSSVDLYNNGLQWYFYNNDIKANFTVPIQQWFHVTLVYNGGGGTSSNKGIYINGVKQTNISTSGWYYGSLINLPEPANLYIGRDGGRNTAYFNGLIDDVRIYDHALSEREVRDLSQGLVLHYTFDQFQEPTENVFTNPIFSGTTGWSSTQGSIIPIGDGVLSLRRSVSGTGEFQLYQVIPFSVGQVTTISFKCKKVEGTGAGTNSFGFDIGVWGMTPTWSMTRVSTEDIGNGWYKLTYVLPAATNSSGGAVTGIHTMTNNLVDTYHIKEIQYERKSYATPFVNGTRAGIVRDQSTQGNDAPLVLANTPKWVEGGMVGKGCYELNQTKYITLPKSTLGSLTNCTFSFWRKRTSAGSWIVGNSGTPTGSSYFMATSGDTGAFYHSGVGTPVIYRDGVLSTTPANDDLWHHYCLVGANLSTWANLHINAYDMGTTWLFRGQIDDVRIYTTALSAEEIRELYQQRASLDSGGNLLC